MNITKCHIKLFIAGFAAFLILSFFWDYENNVQDFKDGFNTGRSSTNVESNE